MSETIRLSRTETFEHTVSGLLKKRAELFNEAERIKDRLAEIKNDIAALDRVLLTLDYGGNLDSIMPRQKRTVVIGAGEAARLVMNVLRTAPAPLSSRDIARQLMEACGQDSGDRKSLRDRTSRISRVLRRLRERGIVIDLHQPEGLLLWQRANKRT